MSNFGKKLSSSQIILLGFLAVILAGTILLMLPFATQTGKSASFFDALFTSTSAVCVTGLVVQDTATYWSFFGQLIILILIQIGGMGIVTLSIAIATFSKKTIISLKQRSVLQEALSAPKVGGIVRMVGFILHMTAIFEISGAVLMMPVFTRDFGFWKGMWYSIFHSISAFCNAGFDLMGVNRRFSSLTDYAAEPVINIVLIALIVIGGIGFFTWEDIRTNRHNVHRYRMQTKVILVMTGILLIIPFLYFFFFEFGGMTLGDRLLYSAFQAVTPRTAGFNTADLSALSQTGIGIIVILMLVGGSPGSTAGGMKTTTLAVMFSTAISAFRRKEFTNFFGRRIDETTVRNTIAILTLYITFFITGGFIISYIEHLPLITCLFETASAVGTVGLTLGITPRLCLVSRAILVFLMYVGRVGGLTLIFATVSAEHSVIKLPKEKMTIG